MASKTLIPFLFLIIASISLLSHSTNALIPYTRTPWDPILPSDDPFRILEQTPLNILRNLETPLAVLARVDWKETPTEHLISVDVPGLKKEDVKIEVEENRVVRISGERKGEEEVEGEKWHRAERTNGKFWRQFKMPGNADLDGIKARMEDGILRIVVPKLGEDKRRQPKLISIAGDENSGQDIKATNKAAM